MREAIQDILDESLEAVLGRGESADDFCRRYPEAAADLKPLLTLAIQGRQSLAVTMPAPAKAALRQRLVSQAQTMAAGRKPWTATWPRSRRLVLRPLVIAAAIMLLGTGTAFAATKAAPDSILYPLKTRLESARTLLAWQKLDRAAAETGNADKRLDEIIKMVGQNKPEYVPGLLASYHSHMDNAAALVVEARAGGEDTSEVEAMIDATRARQRQILGEIEDRLPEEVRQDISEDLDEARDAGLPDDADEHGSGGGQPPAPVPAGGYHDDDSHDGSDDGYYPSPGGGDDGSDDDYPSGGPGSGYPDPGYDDGDDNEVENHPVGNSHPGEDYEDGS